MRACHILSQLFLCTVTSACVNGCNRFPMEYEPMPWLHFKTMQCHQNSGQSSLFCVTWLTCCSTASICMILHRWNYSSESGDILFECLLLLSCIVLLRLVSSALFFFSICHNTLTSRIPLHLVLLIACLLWGSDSFLFTPTKQDTTKQDRALRCVIRTRTDVCLMVWKNCYIYIYIYIYRREIP